MPAETFSRHVNEQFRWMEALRERIRDLYASARSFKMTQDDFLKRRSALYSGETRLTRESLAYVRGYEHALRDAQYRDLIHVRRVIGRPETASSAKWDAMTEELRQACREHRTESCLAWDENGAHPYGPWTIEAARAIVREKKAKGERAYIANSWTGERVE